MAMMEISVVPLGTGSASVSSYVAGAVKILKNEPGITYELTAMGTIVVGDADTLLALAGRMHRSALAAGAVRVVTSLKIDERTDKPLTIEGKKRAVNEKLD
jgi:uncharacterized protein (TIGR00106 family)